MPKEYVKNIFKMRPIQELKVSDITPENVVSGNTTLLLKPSECFIFLKKSNGTANLHANESFSFVSEPYFCLDNDQDNSIKFSFLEKKDETALKHYKWKPLSFEKISKIIVQNNIQYIYVEFLLYCQDSREQTIFQDEITSCIIDLKNKESIEKALLEERMLSQKKVPYPKIVKEYGVLPMWVYDNIKTKTHNLSEIDKKTIKHQQKRAEFKFPPKS